MEDPFVGIGPMDGLSYAKGNTGNVVFGIIRFLNNKRIEKKNIPRSIYRLKGGDLLIIFRRSHMK